MKSFLLSLLLAVIVLAPNLSTAQSRKIDNSRSFKMLELVRALTQDQSSSKTTYTKKKILAYSDYGQGSSLLDSFKILEPSIGGCSYLNPFFFYPYSEGGLVGVPLNLFRPYIHAHSDFQRAVSHYYNPSHPDSIFRNMVDGYVQYEDNISYDSIYNTKTLYFYDAQNRVTETILLIDIGTPDEDTFSILNFYYSPNGDYILCNLYLPGWYDFLDSMVIDNGNLKEVYLYSYNILEGYSEYEYDNNNQLTKIKEWTDTILNSEYTVMPRAGSDYPNWAQLINYNSNGTSDKLTSSYNFNSLGVIESGTVTSEFSGKVSNSNLEFITDSDGDITKITSTNDSGDVVGLTYFYYDSSTDLNRIESDATHISAYPVPTVDQVELRSSEYFTGYNLYDASGKIVNKVNFNKTNQHTIDLSFFIPGYYYIEISGLEKAETILLIKD